MKKTKNFAYRIKSAFITTMHFKNFLNPRTKFVALKLLSTSLFLKYSSTYSCTVTPANCFTLRWFQREFFFFFFFIYERKSFCKNFPQGWLTYVQLLNICKTVASSRSEDRKMYCTRQISISFEIIFFFSSFVLDLRAFIVAYINYNNNSREEKKKRITTQIGCFFLALSL